MIRRIRTVDQWQNALVHREKIEDLLAEIWDDSEMSRYNLIDKLTRIRSLTYKLENTLQ